MSEEAAASGPGDVPASDRDLGSVPGFLRPSVDLVARLKTTVHLKLLAGFLVIALLLLMMGILSIVVIARMNQQVDQLVALQTQTDLARQAIYSVTAQSHYRAMALITEVDSWNDSVASAKANFTDVVDQIDALGAPIDPGVTDRLRSIDVRFTAAGEEVLGLYEAGDLDQALDVHINAEHAISHELETELKALIDASSQRMAAQLDQFRDNRQLLTIVVAIFAAVSLLTALTLGAVLSWSLIRPVRKIDVALARIADGDFDQQVDVPNRDEFGRLTTNLNRTSSRLATLYNELTALNQGLEKTIEEQLIQLRRSEELRRYVSPQVADAILTEGSRVTLAPTRRNLSILVSDIRGFTEMSERMEPEELVDALNQYFGAMTDVVFSNGGTLDKYLGDGILAFFGDPIPFEDHAERAVASAFEMQRSLDRLRDMVDGPIRGGPDHRDRHQHRLCHRWQHRVLGPDRVHRHRQPRQRRLTVGDGGVGGSGPGHRSDLGPDAQPGRSHRGGDIDAQGRPATGPGLRHRRRGGGRRLSRVLIPECRPGCLKE